MRSAEGALFTFDIINNSHTIRTVVSWRANGTRYRRLNTQANRRKLSISSAENRREPDVCYIFDIRWLAQLITEGSNLEMSFLVNFKRLWENHKIAPQRNHRDNSVQSLDHATFAMKLPADYLTTLTVYYWRCVLSITNEIHRAGSSCQTSEKVLPALPLFTFIIDFSK